MYRRHTRVRCVVYVLNVVHTVHTPHDPFVHLFLLIVSTVLLNTYFSCLAAFEFWFGRQASKNVQDCSCLCLLFWVMS